MKRVKAVLRFLGDLLVPGPDLSDQVRAYCRQEGVDPQSLFNSPPPRKRGLQVKGARGENNSLRRSNLPIIPSTEGNEPVNW